MAVIERYFNPSATDFEVFEFETQRAWAERVSKRFGELAALYPHQRELAETTGLPQSTISRVLAGVGVPTLRVQYLVAGALRSKVSDLFPAPEHLPPFPRGGQG